MYRIKYNYDTGSSFHSESGLEDYIELGFQTLEVAEQNLERIREHYEMYRSLHDWFNKKESEQDILRKYSEKDWFVKRIKKAIYKDDINNYSIVDEKRLKALVKDKGYKVVDVFDNTEMSIILYADNGNSFQISCPWCGYFESLNSVEITQEFKKYDF